MIDATSFPAPPGFADMPAEYQQYWTGEYRDYRAAVHEAMQRAPAEPATAWDRNYLRFLHRSLEEWETHTVTDVHELAEQATAHANLIACKAAAGVGRAAGLLFDEGDPEDTPEDLARLLAAWAFIDLYVVDPRPIGDITPEALAVAAETYSEAHWEEHLA